MLKDNEWLTYASIATVSLNLYERCAQSGENVVPLTAGEIEPSRPKVLRQLIEV